MKKCLCTQRGVQCESLIANMRGLIPAMASSRHTRALHHPMRLCFLSKQTSSGACFCLCVSHSLCPLPFRAQKSKLKRGLFSPVTFLSNSPASISKAGSGAHVLQITQPTVLGSLQTTVRQSSSNPCANNTITVSIQTNVPIFSWYLLPTLPSHPAIPPRHLPFYLSHT